MGHNDRNRSEKKDIGLSSNYGMVVGLAEKLQRCSMACHLMCVACVQKTTTPVVLLWVVIVIYIRTGKMCKAAACPFTSICRGVFRGICVGNIILVSSKESLIQKEKQVL